MRKEPAILAEPARVGTDGVFQRLEAKVLCEESEEILTLKGTRGKTNRSFAILYKNTPM